MNDIFSITFLSSESTIFQPAVEIDSLNSNQTEQKYWKNPVDLEKLTHFRVLKAVPIETAHLQEMDVALNALGADIGLSLDRVRRYLHCIKAQLILNFIYLYFMNTLFISVINYLI